MMHHHIDAAPYELGFQVAGQETMRRGLAAQRCVHVGKCESAREYVSVFPWTEFRNWPGLLLKLNQVARHRHCPEGLVEFLNIVHEVRVVGAAQDQHPFRCRSSFVEFVHPGQWQRDIVFRNKIKSRNVTAPSEIKFRWKDSGSWV